MPLTAQASFLDSLLGNDVSADTFDLLSSAESTENSQTMSLLQMDASSMNLKDKNDKSEVQSEVDINIVSENALLPAVNHISTPVGLEDGDSYSDQISVYVVRKGDSISIIADMFGVSPQTILAANDLKKTDKIKESDVLFILPVSGIEHTVVKGQTLKTIAKLYKVEVSDITQFNGITENAKLAVGDKIMIPGGEMIDTEVQKPKTNSINSIKTALKTLVGYFINPVPNYRRLSQGLHGNNSVDLAAPTGTQIVASASGTVLLARKGYNGGYGNVVIINHPNGTQTLYAHQSKIATHAGAKVDQGETIGYVGSTGHSTGPHLHFEVHGAKNPAVNL
ncbi:MAG: LysM peptidoglycan-binding domain-containing M23 family metallopeptidase [Candidatus Paceibacterota bacterium]|jgi:LysM repeat protein